MSKVIPFPSRPGARLATISAVTAQSPDALPENIAFQAVIEADKSPDGADMVFHVWALQRVANGGVERRFMKSFSNLFVADVYAQEANDTWGRSNSQPFPWARLSATNAIDKQMSDFWSPDGAA